MKKIIKIEGMSCQHCVKRITQALEQIGEIDVNLNERLVYLTLQKEETDIKIKEIIEDLGYEVTSIK